MSTMKVEIMKLSMNILQLPCQLDPDPLNKIYHKHRSDFIVYCKRTGNKIIYESFALNLCLFLFYNECHLFIST